MSLKGTEYELFVKEVCEKLDSIEGVENSKIIHNEHIIGLSGTHHQVDLVWTFQKDGEERKYLVECKGYNNRVKKEKVMAFHALLNDVGLKTGIYTSKKGFQSGAVKYADKYGINLLEIRPPEDDDWKGRMRDVFLKTSIVMNTNIRPHIVFGNEDYRDQLVQLLNGNGTINSSGQIFFEYECIMINNHEVDDNNRCTLRELVNKLPANHIGDNNETIVLFRNGSISINNTLFPIDAIEFIYDTVCSSETIECHGDDFIKAIIKDDIKGDEKHLDVLGRISGRLPIGN